MWVRGVAVVVGLTWGFAPAAGADVFCKTKKGAVKVRAACKAKETQLNLADFGAAGPPGEDGADGQLRIFGDGSAGAKTVAVDEVFGDVAPVNPQFTDVTIGAAATLTVPSGTVIRCTGTFTNNGMIVVSLGAAGAFVASNPLLFGDSFGGENSPAEAGISLRSAQTGESGDASAFRRAGIGGAGLVAQQAATILAPGVKAGGGGGAGGSDFFLGSANNGNQGGGSLVVLCQGAVTNNGTITADGSDGVFNFGGGGPISLGGGGGGGGVVILASKTSVTNGATGVINARGGSGQDSDTNEGPSGGGGGGIVHFLAPAVSAAGTAVVTGGAAGAQGAAASVTTSPRSGGGGGGASGGSGGAGGGVETTGTPSAAQAGNDGFALTTTADPSALF